MHTNVFGALTRRAALATAGAAGAAAISTLASSSVAARNSNRKMKKRIDTRAKKKCHTQGEQCTARLEVECANDPGCLALIVCCEFAGRCDYTGFITCTRALNDKPP